MSPGRMFARLVVSVALLAVAACAASAPSITPSANAQTSRGEAAQTTQPAAQTRPAAPPVEAPVAAAPNEYRLDTGDEIKITVFGEPDLSGTFQVSGQGDISMSLIGEVPAKQLTLRQLQRAIEAKLKEGYLRDPQVSAEVVNYRPFYISGEVNEPGEYPYIAGLSLRNAIATAGDFTYRADKRRVLIKSAGSDVEREVEVSPTATIQPGDTIRVRECFFLC